MGYRDPGIDCIYPFRLPGQDLANKKNHRHRGALHRPHPPLSLAHPAVVCGSGILCCDRRDAGFPCRGSDPQPPAWAGLKSRGCLLVFHERGIVSARVVFTLNIEVPPVKGYPLPLFPALAKPVKVGSLGRCSGVCIFAGRGSLGLDQPRLCVIPLKFTFTS